MTWVIDSDTTLTWKAEFENDRRMFDSGVAAINGALTLPISRFLGEPGSDFQNFHDYREWLVFNHRINDDWAVKVGGYSLFYDSASSATIPLAPLPDWIRRPLPSGYFYRTRQDISPFREQYQSAIANVAGKVETGALTHNMVFGTELGWFNSNAFNATSFAGVHRSLGSTPSTRSTASAAAVSRAVDFNSTFYQADYGFYFQDLIDIGEHWKFLAGVRYDHTNVVFNRSFTDLVLLRQFSGDANRPDLR